MHLSGLLAAPASAYLFSGGVDPHVPGLALHTLVGPVALSTVGVAGGADLIHHALQQRGGCTRDEGGSTVAHTLLMSDHSGAQPTFQQPTFTLQLLPRQKNLRPTGRQLEGAPFRLAATEQLACQVSIEELALTLLVAGSSFMFQVLHFTHLLPQPHWAQLGSLVVQGTVTDPATTHCSG